MRILQLLFCLVFCSSGLASQAKNKTRESLFSSVQSEGKLSFFLASLPQQSASDADKDLTGVDLNLKNEKELSPKWSILFSPYVHLENSSRSNTITAFDPQETNFKYTNENFKFYLGYHKEAWEGTDVINPMDIFNAKIYLNPLNSQDRSSAGLFYLGQGENANWQIMFVPKQSTSILPNENSAWWPRQIQLPTLSDKLELRIGQSIQYRISSDQEIERALANNFAARVNFNKDNFDFSIAAAEAAASMPLLNPTLNVTPIQVSPTQIYQLNSPVIITPYYYRRRIAAANLVWTRESQIFRIATQYAQAIGDSKLLPNWSTQSVLELEQNISLKKSDITMIAEWVHSTKPESTNVASVSGVFDRGAMLGFRWPLSERIIWMASYYQDLAKTASFFHHEVKFTHNDQLSSEVFVDLFQGSADTILGAYDKNDQIRYQLNLAY